nr:hypothetical protein [Tanacetum cinerariifolium]
GGGGGGSVDVFVDVTVKLERTSANAVRALKKFVLCRVSTEILRLGEGTFLLAMLSAYFYQQR